MVYFSHSEYIAGCRGENDECGDSWQYSVCSRCNQRVASTVRERLNQALSELSDCQNDFHEKKPFCLKPELTATTWFGEWADDFDSVRESELQESYVEISDEQLDDAISKLEAKIQEIKLEIQSLEASIAAQRTIIAGLYAQGKGDK